MIRGAELRALDRGEPITELAIHDAGAIDLAELRGLDRLERLSITACRVGALDPLAALPALRVLELHFTDATDVAPLRALPALRRASLLGNPWTARSWDVHLPALRAHGHRPPIITTSPYDEWRLTTAMWKRGWPAGVSRIDDRHPVVVVHRDGATATLPARVAALRDLVGDPAMTLARLIASAPALAAPDLTSHRELGDATDAAAWLAAATLPAALARGAARFVARFPGLIYYREDQTLLDAIARDHAVAFPPWLRALRQVLAWVEPGRQVRVQLDGFGDAWYDVGLRGVDNAEQRPVIDRDGLFPIAAWLDTGASIFALSLADPGDLRLVELGDDLIGPDGLLSPALAAFDSFGSLLDHVVAVQVDGAIARRAAT